MLGYQTEFMEKKCSFSNDQYVSMQKYSLGQKNKI